MFDGRTIAIIPARGGSKGIPQKNIRLFAGKPLIAHAIAQALALKRQHLVDRVVVSTDDSKIAAISRRYGAEVPFLRPKRLARDRSPVHDAVAYTLARLEREERYRPDYLLLLQPTSPLRTVEDIRRHFVAFDPRTMDALVTVCPTHHLLFHLGPRGKLIPATAGVRLNPDTARQRFRPGYKLNGCFAYLIKRDVLLRERTFFPTRTRAVVVPAWRSIDLDRPEDWALAELMFRNRTKLERKIEQIRGEKPSK